MKDEDGASAKKKKKHLMNRLVVDESVDAIEVVPSKKKRNAIIELEKDDENYR